MSDLFKLSQQEIDEVYENLSPQLKNNRLKLGIDALDQLPKGWLSHLLAKLEEISTLSLHIFMVNCEFGRMEIHMNSDKTNQLAKSLLWKQRIERESEDICMGCGTRASRQIFQGQACVICSSCKQAVKDSGVTGTWLDKY